MSIHKSSARNRDILSVAGVAVVLPARMSYTIQDLHSENSFRSVSDGFMHVERIATKLTVDCEWSGLDGDEMAELLEAMSNKTFTLKCIDPRKNMSTTLLVYVGDRTPVTPFYDKDKGLIYESFSCSFIEC